MQGGQGWVWLLNCQYVYVADAKLRTRFSRHITRVRCISVWYDNCGVLRLTVTVLRPGASRADRFMLMLPLLLEPPKPTRSAACGRPLLPTHARGCYFARWFYTLLLLKQHTMLSCLLC